MLWLKAFHIIFVVTWFAGLFYLPRLFVYHAQTDTPEVSNYFKTMQRKLLGITHIGGSLAILFGLLLLLRTPGFLQQGWMHAKLFLLVLLLAYHIYCAYLVRVFANNANRRGHVWYRWFNEVPAVLLVAIVLLAVLKPF